MRIAWRPASIPSLTNKYSFRLNMSADAANYHFAQMDLIAILACFEHYLPQSEHAAYLKNSGY